MQQAVSYLQGMSNPFDGVLEAYDSGLQSRRYRNETQAQQVEQARKEQAQLDINSIDWSDHGSATKILAQYPEYTKGVRDWYDQMEAKEQQAKLGDMSRYISVLRNGRPEIATTELREKARILTEGGNSDAASELLSLAEQIEEDPSAMTNALSMTYAVLAGKDNAAAIKDISSTFNEQDKLPSDIAGAQATANKNNTDSSDSISNQVANAAIPRDPQLFSATISRMHESGLLSKDKFDRYQAMMQGTPEEVMARLEGLATQNPEIAKAFKPEINVVNTGATTDIVEYDPQTGKAVTRKQLQNTVSPNQQYSSDTNVTIAGINQEGADRRTAAQLETSRYNNDKNNLAKMYGFDLNDKQVEQKLAFAYRQEDAKKNKAKLETHGGKVYWVYPDSTAVEAKDINGNPIKPTIKVDSSTRKAVAEQQSQIDSGNELIRTLRKAKVLSDQGIYFGKTAGARASIASNFKGGSDTSKRTQQYNTLITGSALQAMKSIFGGNPTEGERAILLRIQASSDYPREVRKKILDEAIAAANNRIKSNQKQITTLQGGSGGKPVATGTNYGSVIEPIKKR